MKYWILVFFFGTIFQSIGQIEPPIQYPEPIENYGYDESYVEVELSDHWSMNSSHVYSPITIGAGYFNFHEKEGFIANRNVPFWSVEMLFSVIMKRKYERDEILRYINFMRMTTYLDGKEVDFKGYQLSAMSMFDALGWKWITLGVNYGFSFGQRKMVSLVAGDKYKVNNPFWGILGGMDLRFNVGRTEGLSFGGYANYMLDLSQNRWINHGGYMYTLPDRTKFTGWQVGVSLGFIMFTNTESDVYF